MMNNLYKVMTPSPWPIMLAMGIMLSMMSWSMKMWMLESSNLTTMNMMITSTIMMMWYRDVIRESSFMGNHTTPFKSSIKTGMILFIGSEIMFFVSFFSSFNYWLHNFTYMTGEQWPPQMITTMDIMTIPMMNTIILLMSGNTITMMHMKMIKSSYPMKELLITLMLGMNFMNFQMKEYKTSQFAMNDSSYGSIFFMSTGFHGIHVMIGMMMITLMTKRMMINQISSNHHMGMEMSAWYWHFVDIVWIMLFIMMYNTPNLLK